MLRPAVLLSLAVVAMAGVLKDEKIPEQIVRIGSIGTTFINIPGVIEPSKVDEASGIPTYHFKYIKEGVPLIEDENVIFRCTRISDFYVPHVETPKPILMCRNEAFEKAKVDDTTLPKRAFLFSAEQFDLRNNVRDMFISFGKTILDQIDDSMMIPLAPTTRVERQIGLGFSGSGAQASSSSFGGGGGFGGFPGGGFGGSFSGSQASAGSGSFGSGGFFG